MKIGSVFENNRTQAVRLPSETGFPKEIKKVSVRIIGNTRVIAPLKRTWDSFFQPEGEGVSDDFMEERATQIQSAREPF